MSPVIARLEPSRNDADPTLADALADLHTRSRQIAYRGLYGDAFLDHELAAPPTAPIAAQGLAVWAHPLPSCRHKVLDPAHEQRAVAS